MGLKALFGIFYLTAGWHATIADWTIPGWLVIFGTIVDGYLAYTAFVLYKKKK